MNVKFINTTSEKLSLLPITDGQIIALTDQSGLYYDFNDTRYVVSEYIKVDKLPDTGILDKLYVSLYSSELGIYIYDGSTFVPISKNIEKLSELENDTDFVIFDPEDNENVENIDEIKEITLTGVDIDGNSHTYILYGKEVN